MSYLRVIQTPEYRFEFSIEPDHLVTVGACSVENAQYVASAYTHWIALLADSPLNDACGWKPKKVYIAFLRQLTSQSFLEIVTHFSVLADKIMKSCDLYGEGSTTGPFLPEMKETPVFKEYLHWWRTEDPDCLTYVLSFLLFLKKAEYQDPRLEATAFHKWLGVEKRLAVLELPDQVISDLKLLAKVALPRLKVNPFRGRFGPGTVYEGGRSLRGKLNRLAYDPGIELAFGRRLSSTFEPGYDMVNMLLGKMDETIDPKQDHYVQAIRYDRVRSWLSELMFVTKNVTSMRSICREEPGLSYFQQALRFELEDVIEQGPLGAYVRLKDQTYASSLALLGSSNGLLDTIDLSSASDSVSLDLVRSIFTPGLLSRMLATRSRIVKYDDGTTTSYIPVVKFAPMGSAVCFPTQSIIYTLVCIREYLEQFIGPKWRENVTAGLIAKAVPSSPTSEYPLAQPLSVYGDDIICDSRVTEKVIHTLHSLGFQVNVEKSFTSSHAFRESCGIYAWNGHDVTPMRWKIKFHEDEISLNALASYISMCNRAGDKGMKTLHKFLVHTVLYGNFQTARKGVRNRTGKANPIRFGEDEGSLVIKTTRPPSTRNRHLQARCWAPGKDRTDRSGRVWTCDALQRNEVKCLAVTVTKGSDALPDRNWYDHNEWMRAAYTRGDQQAAHAGASSGYEVVDIKAKWDWQPL